MTGVFIQHIDAQFSFLKDKKLLLAISGGLDSVVLCHLLCEFNFDLGLAHCNFDLRGKDSKLDQDFVEELAGKLGLPCHSKKFNTTNYAKSEKLSIQMAARELRYQWLEQVLKEEGYDYILTAHHANDSLETFLINLTRGSGLDGLLGIPEKNAKIVRPLLPFSRDQIELYAKEKSIRWREDRSNTETKYLRNKIRLELIPLFNDLNPKFLNSFSKTVENLKMTRKIVDGSVETASKSILSSDKTGLTLDIEKLKRTGLAKAYLYEILKPFGFREYIDVYKLLSAQSGKMLMSPTHRLIKDRETLILTKLKNKLEENSHTIQEADAQLSLPGLKLKISKNLTQFQDIGEGTSVQLDQQKLKFPLVVRKWKRGDYFYPLGMEGKKKLSKFFKDEKMSTPQKELIWLLCSGQDIVWVIGKRMDNRYKVNENTRHILKIEIL